MFRRKKESWLLSILILPLVHAYGPIYTEGTSITHRKGALFKYFNAKKIYDTKKKSQNFETEIKIISFFINRINCSFF